MGREGCDVASVERILRAEFGSGPGKYLFEHRRHQALAAALGLPEYAAGFGYRYLAKSISAGQPLSTEFESTRIPYQDPIDSVLPRVIASARAPTKDDADVTVAVTPDRILWCRRGQEYQPARDSDIGSQLREAEHIPATAVVVVRFSKDVGFERASAVLRSLWQGFSQVRLGGTDQRE
jgi:hypothetical protein